MHLEVHEFWTPCYHGSHTGKVSERRIGLGVSLEQQSSFGARLRQLREIAGLTQEELAGRAGLSPNAISDLERGRRRHPYPHTVNPSQTHWVSPRLSAPPSSLRFPAGVDQGPS
jgi:DNA-binding XRE family transcriptional regulator